MRRDYQGFFVGACATFELNREGRKKQSYSQIIHKLSIILDS